ncbi:MAG: secretin N-terminal domain-containing protein [Burkholderiales bacterium]|nr:secretin N-terminal domain-containing protein [Burkholderiales bacterium]
MVAPALPPRPTPVTRAETYSVVVNEVPVRELLFALARDARVNVDVHPGIAGNVTLNAINQTLPQLLNRIARQVDIRWEMEGNNLSILPDVAFLRTYKVDYVNMSRVSDTTVSVATEIGSTGRGASTGGGATGSSGSNSSTTVTSQSANRFWDSLALNVCSIVAATRVISQEEREALRNQQAREREDRLNVARALAPAGAGAASLMQQVTSQTATAPLPTAQINCTPQVAGAAAATALSVNNPVIVNREGGVLTVFATQRQQERIQEFLDRVMGSARRQVMIEATVVEVELSSSYQQGINWQRLQGAGNSGLSITMQPTGPNTLPGGAVPGVGAAAVNPVTSGLSNPGGTNSGLLQVGYVNPTSRLGNIAAAITLLESFGKVRVLSSPKLSVLNNQTAILKVVNNLVYFTIGATTTPGSLGTPAVTTFTSTPNTVAVGFVMSVTPLIDDADSVAINVRPTISRIIRYVNDPNPALAQAGVVNPVPEVQTREMESILKVPNQQIAVMGGLMQDAGSNNEDAVPGAGRVPILGELFRYRNDQARKSELVIFLRPVILRDPTLDGDFKEFREFLPGPDFFSRPNPLETPRRALSREAGTQTDSSPVSQ